MGKTVKLYAAAVVVGGLVFLGCFVRLYHGNISVSALNWREGAGLDTTLPSVHNYNVLNPILKSPVERKNSSTRRRSVVTIVSTSTSYSSSRKVSYQYKGSVLSVGNYKTEVVSAFFDFRQGRHMITVLGCQNRRVSSVHYYCLVKYLNGVKKCLPKETTNTQLSSSDENTSKSCWSHRFTCYMKSDDTELPVAVALSTSSKCDSSISGWLDIYNNKHETGPSDIAFGVCFQTPFYKSGTWKGEVLVEAIERYKSLGAEWFTLYFRANPSKEVMQVLSQYKIVEAINMTLSDATFYDLRYYGELITIRDCVYRNMHRVKYLALTDVDEVIVPQISAYKNIPGMLSSIDSAEIGAFQFKHVALMIKPGSNQVPKEYSCPNNGRQILKPKFETQTYRTKPFPIPEAAHVGRWKVIVKPLYVDKIGIHSVYQCMSGYHQHSVPTTTGLLYHYRDQPFFDPAKCQGCSNDNRLMELAPNLIDTYISRACSI